MRGMQPIAPALMKGASSALITGHGEKVTRKQEQAIAALLTHATVQSAAKACGIGEATLSRWLRQPAFRERYQAARQQLMDDAVSLLQKASSSAVGVLVNMMRDENAAPSVRVNAAVRVLDFAFKGKELIEMEERLTRLEEEFLSHQEQAGSRS